MGVDRGVLGEYSVLGDLGVALGPGVPAGEGIALPGGRGEEGQPAVGARGGGSGAHCAAVGVEGDGVGFFGLLFVLPNCCKRCGTVIARADMDFLTNL